MMSHRLTAEISTKSELAGVALVASLAVHACAYIWLGFAERTETRALRLSSVEFSVTETRALTPREPEPPIEAEEDDVETAPTTAPQATEPVPVNDEPAQPERDAPPAFDLTGVTLTNTGTSGGWATAVGDGRTMQAPLVGGHQKAKTETPPSGVSKRATAPSQAVPRPPLHVALRDLSKKPAAPNLTNSLESHYPPEARAAGISGTATVKADITRSGVATNVRLIAESYPGFGSACQGSLSGSRWSPPLDAAGRAVTTTVTYRCNFKVRR